MKTSKEWWDEVKQSNEAIIKWLFNQYIGEATAGDRIRKFAAEHATSEKAKNVLNLIASQEDMHASWIAGLLSNRCYFAPDLNDTGLTEQAHTRYWKEPLAAIEDFETGCAVGAHAEKMRLERIQAIVDDPTAPEDIWMTFKKILNDELFHERAFRKMASAEALEKTKGAHELGKQLLGLVA